MNVIDQLKEFRKLYGQQLADAIESEIIFFLKSGFLSSELTIIYPKDASPQVVPREALEDKKKSRHRLADQLMVLVAVACLLFLIKQF